MLNLFFLEKFIEDDFVFFVELIVIIEVLEV